jgi:hypothetical protein
MSTLALTFIFLLKENQTHRPIQVAREKNGRALCIHKDVSPQ